MKILLFTESLGSGGAERQLCGLAVGLKRRGYDVKVVTYVKDQFCEYLLRAGNVDYELHEELQNKTWRALRLSRIIRSFRADVVISFLRQGNKAACLARIFTRFRLIVSERNTNTSFTSADKLIFNLYRMADVVVPNSIAQAEFIRRHAPYLADKTLPIVNFVDCEKFAPPKDITARHPETLVPQIITVARYTEQKNYLRYIRAISIVKERGYNAQFHFYGNPSSKEYARRMEEMIHELRLEDMVFMHEPNNAIADNYRKSDALCLPSNFEGYPNVVCEAMATGLPVICSNVQEMPRIVKEKTSGYLCNPQDPDDIARAIMLFLDSSEKVRAAQGAANRRQMLENNSIEAFVNEYEKVIRL